MVIFKDIYLDLSINESEIETLKESKSKDIRSDIEELGSIQEDNDIEIVFNIFNQDFIYAFKNKLDEENKNTKWNEVSKIKLLKNFSQMIEGAEDSAKNLHAINLISTMQEKHDYSEKELIRNWKNSLGEYITKYNPKFLIDKK